MYKLFCVIYSPLYIFVLPCDECDYCAISRIEFCGPNENNYSKNWRVAMVENVGSRLERLLR